MSKIQTPLLRLTIGCVLLALPTSAAPSAPPNVWWYRTPAAKYWAGLPLSNGRMAAMVAGRVRDESIVVNDESLWTGSPYDPNNPDGPAILQEVRKLLLEGKLVEAQQLCQKMLSRPLSVQHYQPLGELRIRFDGPAEASAYRRELDMDTATARVTYEVGGVHYTREVFASFPDQVLVVRITADKPASISLSARLASIQPSAHSAKDADSVGIAMDGKVETVTRGASANPVTVPSHMRWQARIAVVPEGGGVGTAGSPRTRTARRHAYR